MEIIAYMYGVHLVVDASLNNHLLCTKKSLINCETLGMS